MKPEIYEQLAETGKYYNTGKVLIGSAREPRPEPLGPDEQEIQSALLGSRPMARQGDYLALWIWRAAAVSLLLTLFVLGA